MKVTSTEFRKNLFQILERVLKGELVEVTHKGRLLRMVPEKKPSTLSRLIQHDTINGTLEGLERAQLELDEELRASWDGKWDGKPPAASTRTQSSSCTQEMPPA